MNIAGTLVKDNSLKCLIYCILTLQKPGEIFILLKDELIGEILEVEFISTNKRLRARPARWNKSVWHMKAAGEKFCILIRIKALPEFLSCDL
jgi:hypothetical protein